MSWRLRMWMRGWRKGGGSEGIGDIFTTTEAKRNGFLCFFFKIKGGEQKWKVWNIPAFLTHFAWALSATIYSHCTYIFFKDNYFCPVELAFCTPISPPPSAIFPRLLVGMESFSTS